MAKPPQAPPVSDKLALRGGVEIDSHHGDALVC